MMVMSASHACIITNLLHNGMVLRASLATTIIRMSRTGTDIVVIRAKTSSHSE